MSTIRLYLKANEKIFINGAVLQVSRKIAVDLLNDATFLLENHVMQRNEANTPLKQLYFVVQMMMVHPKDQQRFSASFNTMVTSMLGQTRSPALVAGIKSADMAVRTGSEFNALKTLRNLFPLEEADIEEHGHVHLDGAQDLFSIPEPDFDFQLSEA